MKEMNEEFTNKLRLKSEEKQNSVESTAEKNPTKNTPSKLERKETIANYVDLRNKYISEIDVLKDEIEEFKKEHAIWQLKSKSPETSEIRGTINSNMTDSNSSPIEKNSHFFKEMEKNRKSRISGFFSKSTLDKMVQDIQASSLMRKKSIMLSERAIVDFKKANEVLTQENKRLTELVERVKEETNKNKDFIIKTIQDLEKKHHDQLQNAIFSSEKKVKNFYSF